METVETQILRIKNNIDKAYEKLKEKGAILPDNYERLEWIKPFEGSNVYFDTGYSPNSNSEFTLEFMDDNIQSYEVYIGSNASFYFQRIAGQENNFSLINNSTNKGKSYINLNQKRIITINNKGTFNEKGLPIMLVSSPSTFESSNHYLKIFCRNDGWSVGSNNLTNFSVYRFYSLKIFENDVLVRHYIPARDLKERICLYDKVNGTFLYEANNKNTFEIGPSLGMVGHRDSASLAPTIETVRDEWQPQPDWWDIEEIIKNDNEEYVGKIICLLSDGETTSTFEALSSSKIVTSDGSTYSGETTYTHTWDVSYDKPCSKGYKTRYVIYYYDTSTPQVASLYYKGIPQASLYVIFKDFENYNITRQNWQNGIFQSKRLLEYIKCINTTFQNFPALHDCSALIGVEGADYIANPPSGGFRSAASLRKLPLKKGSKVTATDSLFIGTYNLEYVDLDFSEATSFNYMFQGSYIKIIENLDCNSVVNANNTFQNCKQLLSINNVSNIKISGFNFSNSPWLNRDTLIRIIDALYDYSNVEVVEGEEVPVYTISLGETNLAKLTEEEIVIGTNKGWTIS